MSSERTEADDATTRPLTEECRLILSMGIAVAFPPETLSAFAGGTYERLCRRGDLTFAGLFDR